MRRKCPIPQAFQNANGQYLLEPDIAPEKLVAQVEKAFNARKKAESKMGFLFRPDPRELILMKVQLTAPLTRVETMDGDHRSVNVYEGVNVLELSSAQFKKAEECESARTKISAIRQLVLPEVTCALFSCCCTDSRVRLRGAISGCSRLSDQWTSSSPRRRMR